MGNDELTELQQDRDYSPHRAMPVFPSMLHEMFAHLIDSPGHIAWRAAMICCFRGLLRKCQITASDSMLQHKDFKFVQWGMLITITRSKTIQFKERILEIPITYCPDRELCAVFWTLKHFSKVPADPDSLAFLIPKEYLIIYTKICSATLEAKRV